MPVYSLKMTVYENTVASETKFTPDNLRLLYPTPFNKETLYSIKKVVYGNFSI